MSIPHGVVAALAGATALLVVSGCSRCESADPQLPPCPNVSFLECQSPTCGGNSPVVNGFPINGVHPAGACNAEQVRLMPKSLGGGGCGRRATLDVDERGRLIGTSGTAGTCSGDALKGSRFTVRRRDRSIEITIADLKEISFHGRTHIAYLLTSGAGSLCNPEHANDARKRLGLLPIKPLVVKTADGSIVQPKAEDGDDYVIPIEGELYDLLGMPLTIKPAEGWFSLACVQDALAKRTRYGLASPEVEKHRAALHLLTANYCGNKPYTVRGIDIHWAAPAQNPIPEARWGATKARCINKARLFSIEAPKLPPELLPPNCNDANPPCDHDRFVEAVRAECALPSCETTASSDLQSWMP